MATQLVKSHAQLLLKAIIACIFIFSSPPPLCLRGKSTASQLGASSHGFVQRVLLVGVPAIFGMNFQAISVAQKTKDGGYLDNHGRPSPVLEDAFLHTDQSIGKLIDRLRNRHLLESTLIIITAKHGDSPINPALLRHADLNLIPKAVASVGKGLLAGIEQDGSVALLWLSDQDRTSEVTDTLLKIQREADIQEIYSGDSLKVMFNDPKVDPRVPDIIIQPNPGQIYVEAGSTFIAEHGGNADTDRKVPLLLSFDGLGRSLIKFPVETSQIAPSILKVLGLNPDSLDAVRLEKTPLLPGLDFEQLSRPPASPAR